MAVEICASPGCALQGIVIYRRSLPLALCCRGHARRAAIFQVRRGTCVSIFGIVWQDVLLPKFIWVTASKYRPRHSVIDGQLPQRQLPVFTFRLHVRATLRTLRTLLRLVALLLAAAHALAAAELVLRGRHSRPYRRALPHRVPLAPSSRPTRSGPWRTAHRGGYQSGTRP